MSTIEERRVPGPQVMGRACPRCGAGPWSRCVGPFGAKTVTHQARIDSANTPQETDMNQPTPTTVETHSTDCCRQRDQLARELAVARQKVATLAQVALDAADHAEACETRTGRVS